MTRTAKLGSLIGLILTCALTARSPDGRVTVHVDARVPGASPPPIVIIERGRRQEMARVDTLLPQVARITFVRIPQRDVPAIVLSEDDDSHNTLYGLEFLVPDAAGVYRQVAPLTLPTDSAPVWTAQGRIGFRTLTELATNTYGEFEPKREREYAATASDGTVRVVATTRIGRQSEQPNPRGCNELLSAGSRRAIVPCISIPRSGTMRAAAGGTTVISWPDRELLYSVLTYRGTSTTLVFPGPGLEDGGKPTLFAPSGMPPLVVYPFVFCGRDCSSAAQFIAFSQRTNRFSEIDEWAAASPNPDAVPATSRERLQIVRAVPVLETEYRSAIPIRAKTNTHSFYVATASGKTALLSITVNDGEAFPPALGCWEESFGDSHRVEGMSPCGGWPPIRGTPVPN